MADRFRSLSSELADWWLSQPVFFVATAPAGAGGHVNLSPKGYDTLRVLAPDRVAYLDLTGSGVETIAHLRENGRIVVMLCAFDGPPRILRLHGRGEAVMAGDPRFDELIERCEFDEPAVAEARRAVVVVDVERVADSCGYGVPLMSYEGRRPHQDAWAEKKISTGGAAALRDYQREKNAASLDGLPAVEIA
jgi:hypothetical protein